MKNTVKELAEKMLEKKLNYLPIEDAFELYKKGIVIDSGEHFVISVEDFEQWDYKGNETEFYIKECLKEYSSLNEAFENNLIDIGDDYDHFNEFTFGLFPAPTYMELIKY